MVVQSQDAFGFAGPSGMYKVTQQAHHDSMHNSVVKAPNCRYLRNHGLECSTQAGHFIHLSSLIMFQEEVTTQNVYYSRKMCLQSI